MAYPQPSPYTQITLRNTIEKREARLDMDQMTIRIGALWMYLTGVAAVFLAVEFVVQEIRARIARRRESGSDQRIAPLPSATHHA